MQALVSWICFAAHVRAFALHLISPINSNGGVLAIIDPTDLVRFAKDAFAGFVT